MKKEIKKIDVGDVVEFPTMSDHYYKIDGLIKNCKKNFQVVIVARNTGRKIGEKKLHEKLKSKN